MALQHEVRPNHSEPTAELAERVLLPGDPARALAVAQVLLETPPKMFNHARGLWGYTGIAPDGEPLTVQATGMGGPSAAIVCEELIALGATRLVRIGTCGALDPELELGTLLAAASVLPAGRHQRGARRRRSRSRPTRSCWRRLVAAGARPATIATSDLFYDPRDGAAAGWIEQGALAVEMEAATILQIAARRGVSAACVLGVSPTCRPRTARGGWARTSLEQLGVRVGEAGYAALRSP